MLVSTNNYVSLKFSNVYRAYNLDITVHTIYTLKENLFVCKVMAYKFARKLSEAQMSI